MVLLGYQQLRYPLTIYQFKLTLKNKEKEMSLCHSSTGKHFGKVYTCPICEATYCFMCGSRSKENPDTTIVCYGCHHERSIINFQPKDKVCNFILNPEDKGEFITSDTCPFRGVVCNQFASCIADEAMNILFMCCRIGNHDELSATCSCGTVNCARCISLKEGETFCYECGKVIEL